MLETTYTTDVIKARQEVRIQKILKTYEQSPICK